MNAKEFDAPRNGDENITSINKGQAVKLHNESYHFNHQQVVISSIYCQEFSRHQREKIKNMLIEKRGLFSL